MILYETNDFTDTYINMLNINEGMSEEDKIKAEYNKLNQLSLGDLRSKLSGSEIEEFYGKDHVIATLLALKFDKNKVNSIIGIEY